MSRKMPVKTATIHLKGDYEGWSFVARTNCPIGAFADIASGSFDRVVRGLAKIVVSWDFVNEEGVLLPPPTEEIIGSLPFDLATEVANVFVENINTLPKA
jgi:hypothetical protein